MQYAQLQNLHESDKRNNKKSQYTTSQTQLHQSDKTRENNKKHQRNIYLENNSSDNAKPSSKIPVQSSGHTIEASP